ncbi:penicillin-binding protein activator [Candidatus Pacebacteria bacterium]|nr:penicillin-binding protein activator [Candidatus Paceibacterota bacterium]
MKKVVWGVVVIIILILIVVAVSGDEKEGGPIKIGVLAPLTGDFAFVGEDLRGGIMNAGVSKEDVEFIFEDSACDNQATLSAYQKLNDIDKVKFIIGPGCGASQEIVATRVADDGKVVLLPSAAARSLYIDSGENLFNAQYSLEDESKFIADKFNNLGYEKVVLVTYNNPFSTVHSKSFKENYKGEIVAELMYSNDTTDLSTELLKLNGKGFDAVYSPDLTFFFTQGKSKLAQLGHNQPIFSVYTAELPAVRELMEGVTYAFPGDIDGGNGAFYELAKLSTEILSESAINCDGDYQCVKDELKESGVFDEFGVRKQSIILKKIVDGEAVMFEN